MQNAVTVEAAVQMRLQEMIVTLNHCSKSLFNVCEGMKMYQLTLENVFKMVTHVEVMTDKFSRKMDQLLDKLGGSDAGDGAGIVKSSTGDVLTHPDLMNLRDRLAALEIADDRSLKKFHNAFVQKYTELLLHYQKHGNCKVNQAENKVLYEFVKNQKTNLRNYWENSEGPFAKDSRYVKFLKYLGVTYVSKI
jgi:hypothetical protein